MFLTKCSACVFISLRDCDRVLLLNYKRFRVLHAVDSLNVTMNYDRNEQSNSVSCRHFQRIILGLPLENRVLLFV